jgi:hypothetical protein
LTNGGALPVNPAVITINFAPSLNPPTIVSSNPATIPATFDPGLFTGAIELIFTGQNLEDCTWTIDPPLPLYSWVSGYLTQNSPTVSARFVGVPTGTPSGTYNFTLTSDLNGEGAAFPMQVVSSVNPNAPTLSGISPNSGTQGTNVPITLTGTNLATITSVNAGVDINIPSFVAGATSVTCTLQISSGATLGARNITVTSPDGISNVVSFTVNSSATPGPTLASISPTSGQQGQNVNILLSGTNLSGSSINAGAGITVSNVSAGTSGVTALFAIQSGAATGTRNITVTAGGQTSNAVTFTVTSSVTPATGIMLSNIKIINTPSGVADLTITSNIDLTGTSPVYKINGVPIGTGGGGGQAQTPWLSNINGGGFNLSNVFAVTAAGAITGDTIIANSAVRATAVYASALGNLALQFFGSKQGLLGVGKIPTTYQLEVSGDVDITGTYRVNGTPIGSGGGAAQTPWTQNIDAAAYNLTNVGVTTIGAAGAFDQSSPAGILQVAGGFTMHGSMRLLGPQQFGVAVFNDDTWFQIRSTANWDPFGPPVTGLFIANLLSGAAAFGAPVQTGFVLTAFNLNLFNVGASGITLSVFGPHNSGPQGGPVNILGSGDTCYLSLDTTTASPGYSAIAFYAGGVSGGEIGYYTARGAIQIWTSNATANITFTPTGSGNLNGAVGINNYTPVHALDVIGAIRVQGDSSASPAIPLRIYFGNTNNVYIEYVVGTGWTFNPPLP